MWTFDFEQKCGHVDILKTHPKLLWGTTYFLPNGISQDAQWQRAPSLSRCPGRYLSAVMAADIYGLCLKMMYTIIPLYNLPQSARKTTRTWSLTRGIRIFKLP